MEVFGGHPLILWLFGRLENVGVEISDSLNHAQVLVRFESVIIQIIDAAYQKYCDVEIALHVVDDGGGNAVNVQESPSPNHKIFKMGAGVLFVFV